MSVTRAAVISTTNMTGFLMSRRGSSLRTACGMAARRRSGSKTPRGRGGAPLGFAPPRVTKRWKRRVPRPRSTDIRERAMLMASEDLPGVLEELLDDRPERKRREERQRADDDDDPDQEDASRARPWSGTCPATGRRGAWRPSSPARARIGTIIPYRPTSIAKAPVTL